MDNEQADWIFKYKIMICENCGYRGKNAMDGFEHLNKTGHRAFIHKSIGELPWTEFKKSLT